MKHYLGIDIGSTATKVVVIDERKTILKIAVVPLGTGAKGAEKALQEVYSDGALQKSGLAMTIATGYGRRIFAEADNQISELSCHAKGVYHLFPEARTVIDIGGQDLKVIRLNSDGSMKRFIMNDKCAAGTGRFLESMCRVLNINIGELQNLDVEAKQVVPISNTCAVFAESEVISSLSSGKAVSDVVAGIHHMVAKKVAGLVKQMGGEPLMVMTGGVARNAGIVRAMEAELKTSLTLPPNPQITGALGAALYALDGAPPVNIERGGKND